MALQYLFDPNQQYQNRNGVNNVGGFLRVYLNGTDDRAVTYSNFDGGLNEPDIVLDTDGRSVVIVDDTKTYRIEVYDADGSLMWTVTNYKARGGSGGGSGTPVSVDGTAGEIDVYENTVGGVKHFIVSLAENVKNAISSLTSAVNGLALSLGNKKERQTPKEFFGSTTKTVVGVSQDENGEMYATFDDIAFPNWTSAINEAVSVCEKTANKKNTLTGYESSTTAYPSIKAVVDFVNTAMQNLGGKLITDNGDPFTDSSDLPSTTPYQGVDIEDKDYAYIQGVGTAERWSATVSGTSVSWLQEYAISIPVFTPQQQAAIDSGATSTKIGNYDSHIANTAIHVTTSEKNTWNGKQSALPTSGTPSDTYAINVSGTARYSENVLPYYVSTDNDKSWLEVGTYKANNSDEMYSGITFAIRFRSVDGHTQCGFLWISVGEWKSGGGYSNADIVCEYYTLGRRVKEPSDSVKLYVNILGSAVTDGVKIYAYLAGYSNISLTPLNVNKGTYTSSMTYLNDEPATKKEVTYCNLLRSTYGTAIGSSSTPIYVDEYGIPKPCWTIGFADSAKQISDYRGTEGQDGYKAIYGGYNNGTGEFGLGISKRVNGETKSTEINADGITTNGLITAGIGFVGNLNGVANRAVSDSDGNAINTTYAKKILGIYNLDQYLAQGSSFLDVNLRKQLGYRYAATRGFTPLMMFYGIINFVDIEYADGYDYAAVDFELYNTLQSGTYGTLMASIGMVVPKGTSSIVIPLPFAWNSGSFSPTLYGNFAHRITAGSAICNAYYYSLPV